VGFRVQGISKGDQPVVPIEITDGVECDTKTMDNKQVRLFLSENIRITGGN